MKKNKSFLPALLIVLIAIILVLAAKTVITSAKDLHSNQPVCYKSIEIERADTLWSIAEEYAPAYHSTVPEYVRTLKELNSLSSDRIISGNHLLVAYYTE